MIIGLGSIAKKHISAIRKRNTKVYLYALRSLNTADNYQDIINVYDLNELDIKFDFVIISNPTNMHEETILNVLHLNCPLFIEKPVLSNLTNANLIIEKIKKKQIITYVACNMRFHPALIFIKNYLYNLKTQINEVNIYSGSYLPAWRPGINFRESYSTDNKKGGGVNLDLIHELDYCTWLFGKPIKISSLKRSESSLSIESFDCAYYNLIYSKFIANISLNYFRRDAKRKIEILTIEDTIVIDLLKNKIFKKVSGEILYQEKFTMADTYYEQLNYFIDHIQNNKYPMNDINEGIEVLKLAL